jgi:hypothetical protein
MKLHGYDRLIFKLKNTSIFSHRAIRDITIDYLTLANETIQKNPFEYRYKFILNLDYFNNFPGSYKNGNKEIYLPFYKHPNTEINSIELSKKKGILFYGANSLQYDSNILKSYFKLVSRTQVYNAINSSSLDFVTPLNYDILLDILNDQRVKNKFVFLNSEKVWIPIKMWSKILGSFDFFICTPGVSMPHAHNCIEAMSLGTIPIIQYSNWFSPPLEDNVNCIQFSSLEDLVKKIPILHKLDSDTINKIRSGVLKYYSEHIDPLGFENRINKKDSNEISLFFNAEELSLKYLNNYV